MKPNFEEMPRKELIAYVLSHREDDEAFDTLIRRRSSDAEATWYKFPDTEEGQRQMDEVFRQRLGRKVP
jgi:hypothetical protein